jgi:hypothetical protein
MRKRIGAVFSLSPCIWYNKDTLDDYLNSIKTEEEYNQ